LLNALGHHVASLILFGSALEKGCSRESDIDLLLLIYDPVEGSKVDRLTGEAMKIVESYRSKGYILSLNVLTLSEFIKLLIEGNTLALKIVTTGYPIIGEGLFKSLRKFVEGKPIALDRIHLIESSTQLVSTARALLEVSKRDLFTACGYLKTATGYLLAINTNIIDPDRAIDIADKRLSETYLTLKSLCKQALKGNITPQTLEELTHKLGELLKEYSNQGELRTNSMKSI